MNLGLEGRVAIVCGASSGMGLAIAWGASCHYLGRSLPEIDGRISVTGLSSPVDIIRDSDAVPHIFAANVPDALFGLGYAHAQDRPAEALLQRVRELLAGQVGEPGRRGAWRRAASASPRSASASRRRATSRRSASRSSRERSAGTEIGPSQTTTPRRGSGQGFGYGPELLDEMTATRAVHIEAPPAGW